MSVMLPGQHRTGIVGDESPSSHNTLPFEGAQALYVDSSSLESHVSRRRRLRQRLDLFASKWRVPLPGVVEGVTALMCRGEITSPLSR